MFLACDHSNRTIILVQVWLTFACSRSECHDGHCMAVFGFGILLLKQQCFKYYQGM